MNKITQQKYQELVSKGYKPSDIEAWAKSRGYAVETPAPEKSVGGFVGNVVSSAGKAASDIVGGLATAVTSPIQTASALGQTALGGVQKLIPGTQESERVFDSVVSSMSEKYQNGILNALYEDPFGVALDASTVFGGAGLGLKAASVGAKAAKAGEAASALGKAAKVATKVADVVDPAYWAMRAGGNVARRFGDVIGQKAGTARAGVAEAASAVDKATGAKAGSGILSQLPAGTQRQSALIPGVEAVAARGLGGAKLAEKFEGGSQAIADAAEAYRKTLSKADPNDFEAVGQAIADTVQKQQAVTRKLRNEAYSVAKDRKGISKSRIATAAASEILDAELRTYSSAKGVDTQAKKLIQEARDAVRAISKKGDASLKDTIVVMEKLYEMKDSVGYASPTWERIRPAYEALEDAYDATLARDFPERAKALTKAKELHGALKDLGREGITAMVERAQRTGNYEQLSSLILSDSVPSKALGKLMDSMDQKQRDIVRANVFQRIIDRSRKTSDGPLNAGIIKRQLEGAKREKVRAVIGDYGIQGLEAIERLSEGFAAASKTYSGSQTAAQAQVLADVALASSVASGIMGGGLGVAARAAWTLGSKIGFAKFLASDWGQRWIAEGMNMRPAIDKAGDALQNVRRVAVVTGGTTSEL